MLRLRLLRLARTRSRLTHRCLITRHLTCLYCTRKGFRTSHLLRIRMIRRSTLYHLEPRMCPTYPLNDKSRLNKRRRIRLPRFHPITYTASKTYCFLICSSLPRLLRITVIRYANVPIIRYISLLRNFLRSQTNKTMLLLIRTLTGTFTHLLRFLLYLIFMLYCLLLSRRVNAMAFLKITIVSRQVIRNIRISTYLPRNKVRRCKNICTRCIVIRRRRTLPPMLLCIILRLRTILPMIVRYTRSIMCVTKKRRRTVFLTIYRCLLGRVFLSFRVYVQFCFSL